MSNESTPFLIDLGVIREYGLVIDCHYNRVYSHKMKRYFPCAILVTGLLAVEMMPSKSDDWSTSNISVLLSWMPGGMLFFDKLSERKVFFFGS